MLHLERDNLPVSSTPLPTTLPPWFRTLQELQKTREELKDMRQSRDADTARGLKPADQVASEQQQPAQLPDGQRGKPASFPVGPVCGTML